MEGKLFLDLVIINFCSYQIKHIYIYREFLRVLLQKLYFTLVRVVSMVVKALSFDAHQSLIYTLRISGFRT